MRIRLGELLIKSGVITEEQLKRALKLQEQGGLMLGEALIKAGFTTEEAITMAISKQIGVPYASRENGILKPEKGQGLESVVNEKFARDQLVVPLFMEDSTLAVAMADPTNVLLLDNLRLMTGCEIQPFISSKAQLLNTIDQFYAGSADSSLIDKVMEKPAAGGEAGEEMQVDLSEEVLDLDKVTAEAKGGQVVGLVSAIMKQSIAERASDIHLDVFEETVALRFRVDGSLHEKTPPPKEAVGAIISRVKILSKLDIAERRLPQDGAFSMKYQNRKVDVRVSVMPTVFGEKLVMRLLDKGGAVKDIKRLGFDPRQMSDFLEAASSPHGLIFLTGPTGSGKTTTLYAVLQHIYTPEMNFMTAEDPVEFKLAGISQCQMKASIGLTFASALRSFLRQDPDVILVGEVRDKETAEICLKAAMTGHLVLSTLHTNDAMGAVPRLCDMGMEPYMLADAIQLVAAQRLVRALCECKKPYRPAGELVEQCRKEILLPPEKLPPPEKWVWYKETGCDKCGKVGFLGRRAVYEVYRVNQAMRKIIAKTQDLPALREEAWKTGMWNMRASGWRHVMNGVTTPEEVLDNTMEE